MLGDAMLAKEMSRACCGRGHLRGGRSFPVPRGQARIRLSAARPHTSTAPWRRSPGRRELGVIS
jgi:7-keto-8-aminopelargonate synthetase-like enzyme